MKMRHIFPAAPACALMLSVGSPALADMIQLQPAFDTTLNEFAPDNNMGAHGTVHAGTSNNGTNRRGLFFFDLSSIPPQSVINSATLTLTVSSGNTLNASLFDLHRVLTPWTEGSGSGENGAPGLAGEATWNTADGVAPWGSPGGQSGADYVNLPSAGSFVDNPGPYQWAGPGVVADVQAWVSGSAVNEGWILINNMEGVPTGTARRFDSRESGLAPPTLSVEFTVIPEPGTLSLLGLGILAAARRHRRTSNA